MDQCLKETYPNDEMVEAEFDGKMRQIFVETQDFEIECVVQEDYGVCAESSLSVTMELGTCKNE